jgi:general nucleoside transport system ATP-binding protein
VASSTNPPMLEMRGIVKRWPGVVANDGIDFDLHSGTVHTLLGENGAGKSTLMKILYGFYQPDEGEIRLHGSPIRITSPADAIALGIGMIHQHFMLVPTLTVAENVALGLPSSRGPLTDLDRVSSRIRDLSETYGLRVDPDALVWQLSVGERQRVEIIKALYREASLLVLDEPTAVLTPPEVNGLFATLRKLVADGRGLVFITHKMDEVFALSDHITVLRNGRVAGRARPADVTHHELARMMMGRDLVVDPDHPPIKPGAVRLAIHGLRVAGDRGGEAVRGLDLQVRGGEIVAIAGVSGNGQRELAEAIAGLRAPAAGEIRIDGVDVAGRDPGAVRAAGLSFVPEERMLDGAIGDFSVAENLILLDHGDDRFARRGLLRFGEIRSYCRELVERFAVKTPSLETTTRTLSGGNIQKLIMARELSGRPGVLIAAQPTRGLDVGAAEYIRRRLMDQRTRGTAIVVISEDLDEVLALADRIAVMYEGQIIGVVDRARATRDELGLMMAGVRPERQGAATRPD